MTDLQSLLKDITEKKDEQAISSFFEILNEHLLKFYFDKGFKKILAEKLTFFAIEWILTEWSERDKKDDLKYFDIIFHNIREESLNLIQFKTFREYIERREPNYFLISPKQLWSYQRKLPSTTFDFWDIIDKTIDSNIFTELVNKIENNLDKTLSTLVSMNKKLEAI
jgi:hypothetical protein